MVTDDVLDAARSGDARAFEALVGPLRGELHAHCYRMLGSTHDADDAIQDSMARAWSSIGRLDERGHVRAWLYKIATNRCLTAIERRGRRVLPVDLHADIGTGAPITEVRWLGPYPGPGPEQRSIDRESVELAFVAAVQHLSPTHRAVLLLREVLGFPAAEVAILLDTTTASVNSALQRARAAITRAAPTQQTVVRDLGDVAMARLVGSWTRAWETGNVDAIVTMLTDDARYSMPPVTSWFDGPDRIRAFLLDGPLRTSWRLLPTTANGQVAFGTYRHDDTTQLYLPGGLDVIAVHNGQVRDVVSFLDADLTRFGLPHHIDGSPPTTTRTAGPRP